MTRRAVIEAAYAALLTLPPALPAQPLTLLRAQAETDIMTYAQALQEEAAPPALIRVYEARCDGVTLEMRSGRRLVLFAGGGSPGRRRFTLAHELGHALLRHQAEAARLPAEEAEADVFAAHFLMPVPLLRLLGRRGALTPGAVAGLCQVTETAAARMLRGAYTPVDASLEARVLAWAQRALHEM